MATETSVRPSRRGTGWLAGYAISAVLGLVAWALSEEWTLGAVLFVVSGGGLGATFEQLLRDVALTAHQRRLLFALLSAAVLAVVLLLVALLLGARTSAG